jgi:hypothetical protein
MKRGLNIFGVLLALVGLVWLLQGLGVLQGSIMSDQSQWAVIGVVVFIIGGGIVFYSNRGQAQS